MPRSVATSEKRLKLKTESASECSSESTTKSKKYGKMTRSNLAIGNLTIEKACEVATKITGYHKIDLLLPHRCEADAANSMKWIENFEEDDVVIQRKLCLICMANPMDAFFKTHVAKMHPSVVPEMTEVMRRLSDVRYSRFCHNGFASWETVQEEFPYIHPASLLNFLAEVGFTICKKRSSIPKAIDFEKKFEESDVRGVAKAYSSEIIENLRKSSIHFKEEIEFSSEAVTSSRMLDPSTQTTVQCHICDKISNIKNFKRHMQVHKRDWNDSYPECSIDDVTEIFKRITDIRKALYYSSQPISLSDIEKVTVDTSTQKKLVDFLLNAGFVVESSATLRNKEIQKSCSSKIVLIGPESTSFSLWKEENIDVEECESSIASDFASRSRSSSVTSDSSSVSSISSSRSRIVIGPCSSPSEEEFPYCVLNAIPEHIEVEHELFNILEKMTDDSEFVLSQVQYNFLIGYTMYCLVVSNGSKQNVISRMTVGDLRRARLDETTGLHLLSFSTASTCTQADSEEYLCADERVWRAMEIYEAARERRAAEMGWDTMNDDASPFFFSYVSPTPIVKDTNYFMSQFLRICGIEWPCRSSAICSAAWSLVPKDSKKVKHKQYAITYFKLLREKEQRQLQLLDDGLDEHPTYKKITSLAFTKTKGEKKELQQTVRKKQKRYTTPERKGLPNKPRGGDRKSKSYLLSIGRNVYSEINEDVEITKPKRHKKDIEPPEDEPETLSVNSPLEELKPELHQLIGSTSFECSSSNQIGYQPTEIEYFDSSYADMTRL